MSDQLSNEALRGEALQAMKNQSGYKILINEIIFPLYREAMIELEEKDSSEARAMIKACKHLVEKIDDSINLGNQAREEFKATLAQHTQASE
jgi:hypothetical protein